MERDAHIFRSFMAAQLSIKLLCSRDPKVAKLWDSLYLGLNIALLPLIFYNDSRHWPKILKHYSWWCYFMCNAKPFCSTVLSTGYFVDVNLAISAETNCSESTLVFCCTAQLVLVVNYHYFFPLPPSLWRRSWPYYCHLLNKGHSYVFFLSLCSDFPQACWPRCLWIWPANRNSCPIQHVLFCIQLIVLGRWGSFVTQ